MTVVIARLIARITSDRRFGVMLAMLALTAYAVMIVLHIGTYAAGSDASGYMNHARLLASGNLHPRPRVLSGLTPDGQHSTLFVPLGFVPSIDGNGMVPTYPSGVPLMVATAAQFVGWERAGDVVLCVHSLLGLLLVYSLGRTMGLSPRGSVLGAVILAASPLYINYSIQMMSDLPALVWTLGAVLAAWHSRERAQWALVAGAAAAGAVLIRPTNVLIFAPIAVALGLSPRRWILLTVGGLPGAIFFCFHSHSLYGRLFTTGYGNFTSSFGPEWVGVTWWHYALWLPALFTPVVLLAGGLPWLARTEPRKAALLGTWALVFAAFYSAYVCTHETWWYLRFLLPALPPLVVGGLLVARQAGVGRRWPLVQNRVFAIALIAIIANSALWNKRLPSFDIGRDNKVYQIAAAWLNANLPDNAVILSMQMSGTLYYYTDFTFLRWDSCDAENRPGILAALRDGRRPLYAALYQFETETALHERMPGRWTLIATGGSEPEIWRYEPDEAAAPLAVTPSRIQEIPTPVWRLPIDQSPPIRRAYLLCNLIAWLALAILLWQLIPGNDWRAWLARGGVLFSAGAIASIRFALTDLITLALLAGAMLALERRRYGWSTCLLGVAVIGRNATLLALPAVATPPWLSRSNLLRVLAVLGLITVSTTAVYWRLGLFGQFYSHVAWPFGSFMGKWADCFAAIFQGRGLGLAWIGFVAIIGITVQAVFFLRRWSIDEPWWRFGIAYAGLMCLLDDTMWRGAAAGATRLLLPLTLAFNVVARRCRVSPAWLLAGNLAVAAGFSSLFFPSDPPWDMAAIRAAGFGQLSAHDANWYDIQQSARHTWSWSRGSAGLNVEAWPHSLEQVGVAFSLRSLTPRTVVIRQGVQVLWAGAVNRDYTRAAFSCHLSDGRAFLDLSTDTPAVAEESDPYGRRFAFAIYDPLLALRDH